MTANLVQGGIFTAMVLRVENPHDSAFASGLAAQIAKSPRFFANAPVILDLKDAEGCTSVEDFEKIKAILKRNKLMPVGVQNGSAAQQRAAAAAELAAFASSSPSRRAPEPQGGRPAAITRTRVVAQPVRSGTQIYSKGGDLIVLGSVSPGAEVIADGHIHVYGALRGRAIAGATGDTDARIFANRLEAELICVAGRYIVNESIAPEFLAQSVQVALVEERLTITKS